MVDLKTQYEKIQAEIDRAVLDVVSSTEYINGPEVRQFQADLEAYLGGGYVIPCANGTDALQIAMMALGLKAGDEVIVPAFTYVATAEVIALLGLTPVMVDVDPDTFNMTTALVEAAITPRTRAIVPVHLFGQSVDMEPLLELARRHNLYVIEDNAQAIGADYTFANGIRQKTGMMGDIGCTSFFPSKNLGCYGDGGAMMTRDADLAKRMRMIANHGQDRQYYHAKVGVNSRLDSIQAAILRVKLPHLDEYCDARRHAADYYDAAFAEIPQLKTPVRQSNSTHVFHQYTLVLLEGDRDALRQHLTELHIPAMIYYPVPLYDQQAFSHYWAGGKLPVTESLCNSVISLPMHTELTSEIQDIIINAVKSYFEK
jgi:UDP-2-acetamido-2-deoxy-ribo-hexuluronate aminotransferase